jgi:very-short-patch-repair endonuclease
MRGRGEMSRDFARKLRRDQTDVERKLWSHLRNRKFRGLKFRRQEPIGSYMVDFVCFEIKFVIELDGGQHGFAENIKYDEARTAYLGTQGFRVKRIWNSEMIENFDRTMDALYFDLEEAERAVKS